jgi:hypothetical protein
MSALLFDNHKPIPWQVFEESLRFVLLVELFEV